MPALTSALQYCTQSLAGATSGEKERKKIKAIDFGKEEICQTYTYVWPSISNPVYLPREINTSVNTDLYEKVCNSLTHSSQYWETAQLSTNRWLDKQIVVNSHDEIVAVKRNKVRIHTTT